MIDSTTTGLVQQFIQRTGQLYSLPTVAAEVLRLTGDPSADARRLKDCLERDPALTTRVLKVVNSSLFGLARQVSDLGQALALLGTAPLKMLVLGFSLPRDLFTGLEASVLARYWRHTLTKAVAARELAERAWRIPGDEPFTAALVQDVGVLVLCQQLGDSYLRLLDHVQSHGGSLLDRELDVLGFDHTVLTARLLGHWGLPPTLCAAVAAPPDETKLAALDPIERTLPQILHLAELLARTIEQPYGPALAELLAVGGRYCGLTYPRLQPVVTVLQTRVEELAEVLALELPSGESYVDLLIASQARLAELSLDAVAAQPQHEPEEELLALAGELRWELDAVASGHKTTVVLRPAASAAIVAPPLPPPDRSHAVALAPIASPRTSTAAVASEPGLSGRIDAAIGRCRQARCPLTLALVEIDRHEQLVLHAGPAALADLVHSVRIALDDCTAGRARPTLVGDATFALVWEDCARSDAVRSVRQVLSYVKTWPFRGSEGFKLSLSAGVATLAFPPRNFPGGQLLDAATRCLSGALLSGGDTLKSIEF
jgi:HD-like signal output (HDOD) protein